AGLGAEITHRGGDALLGGIGVRHGEIAVDELAVLVGEESHAGLLAGLTDGRRVFRPMLAGNAGDRKVTALAVPLVVDVEIALDLLEIRQNVVPAPALGAAGNPFCVV